MIPAPFEYRRADSVAEAISELANAGEDAKLLAGGHSLIPLMRLRFSRPSVLIDVSGLAETSFIELRGDRLVIGACTRYSDLLASPLVAEKVPMLAAVTRLVGDPQVRHRGTIGGAIAHGDPAADLPAAMLALEATMVIRSASGVRRLTAADFFVGFLETALAPQEMLVEIELPALGGSWGYEKFNRRSQDWAIVGCAAVHLDRWRVALVNMDAVPRRATAVEEALDSGASINDAAMLAAEGFDPPEDLNASPEFRKHLARVLVRRALETATAGTR